MKKPNKKGKKLLISAIALVLVAAIGVGIWFGTRGGGDPVNVYSFDYVGMTEFWGDTQESYGPVTTDRIQTVFLSDTQTVTEVMVKEGDQVKKGDILLSFDTTLSDLQLERKRLAVEKEKLQLDVLNSELTNIQNMKPMTPMDEWNFVIPEPSLGTELTEPYKAYVDPASKHDGKSMATAFVCRLKGDTVIDDELLEALRREVWDTAGFCEHGVWEPDCPECHPPKCIHDQIAEDCPVCALDICEHGNVRVICQECHKTHTSPVSGCAYCSVELCEHFLFRDECPICNKEPDPEPTTDPDPDLTPGGSEDTGNGDSGNTNPGSGNTGTGENGSSGTGNDDGKTEPSGDGDTDKKQTVGTPVEEDPENLAFSDSGYVIQLLANESSEPGASEPEVPAPENPIMTFYVVFKITEGNMDLGATTLWQGVYVYGQGTDFSLSFFTPMIEDYTLPEEEEAEIEGPNIDFGSGYTAAELSKMRKEQEKKVKDQELKMKMAEAEYKIMQRELNDGNIYADFDGQVVSLLSEEESRQQEQPMVKVSGGGGFYITGSVSELEKENLVIGQEVTVNDWRNGGVYTGSVQSIGDFPSSLNSWNGSGNPTTTYYPFTAFVGEEANLQSGNYVSVQYSTSGSTNGIYMDKAFVRTEKGTSFVYLRGEDGRLEKRIVTTGKSLWGSYLEILDGVTPEDMIAFPYGKTVKEGAQTAEGNISSLYGY